MKAVSLSGATAIAGARLGETHAALAADGVTIVGGCGPTVGIGWQSALVNRRPSSNPREPEKSPSRRG